MSQPVQRINAAAAGLRQGRHAAIATVPTRARGTSQVIWPAITGPANRKGPGIPSKPAQSSAAAVVPTRLATAFQGANEPSRAGPDRPILQKIRSSPLYPRASSRAELVREPPTYGRRVAGVTSTTSDHASATA